MPTMIAIDTNILARFYVEDPNDVESLLQRPMALKVLTESKAIFVPKTVILELEWVLRAFYSFGRENFIAVVRHLLGLAHVHIEDWEQIDTALNWHQEGLDFADALHLAASAHCEALLSFDDKGFARKSARRQLHPLVRTPR
jgi:predicted nucleic-acid-binding protein